MQTWRELRFQGFWHVCLTGLSALLVIASAAAFMSGTVSVTQQPPPAAVAAAALPGRAYDISAGLASQAAAHKLAEQELASVLHRVHMLHVAHVQAVELRAKQAEEAREHAAWLAAHPPAKPHAETADAVTSANPVAASGYGGRQACIIRAESGGNPQIWNPTGHWGLYQFSYATWVAHGGIPADFGHAGAAEQTAVFWKTVAADGYSDWAPYDGC